jgi:hypothetical protein
LITIKEEFVGGVKWRRAIKLGGPEAILLWLAMKRYVAETLSNGFVPDDELDALPGAPEGVRAALEALLGCGKTNDDGSRGHGLVDPHQHGWQLHDYLDHANSAEQEAVRRERERKRKADYRSGLKAGQSRGTETGQPDGTVRGTAHAASRAGTHARVPNPTQPNPTDQPAVAAAPTTRIPCPRDLALTEPQRQTLITGGIPAETIGPIEIAFRAANADKPDDVRTLEAWRSTLLQRVSGKWRGVYADLKAGTAHGTVRGTPRNAPRQPNAHDHLDDASHAAAMGAKLE